VKINDALFGLLLLVLGGWVLVTVQSYPSIPGQKFGPDLFPGLIATVLCVCGGMLVIQGVRTRNGAPWIEAGDWTRSARHVRSVVILVASVTAYIMGSEAIGFLPLSILTMGLLMVNQRMPLLKSLLLAVALSLVIHLLFYKLLRVPLPWGWLLPIAW
jgi:putative tricarboxylic transport membrane protein